MTSSASSDFPAVLFCNVSHVYQMTGSADISSEFEFWTQIHTSFTHSQLFTLVSIQFAGKTELLRPVEIEVGKTGQVSVGHTGGGIAQA